MIGRNSGTTSMSLWDEKVRWDAVAQGSNCVYFQRFCLKYPKKIFPWMTFNQRKFPREYFLQQKTQNYKYFNAIFFYISVSIFVFVKDYLRKSCDSLKLVRLLGHTNVFDPVHHTRFTRLITSYPLGLNSNSQHTKTASEIISNYFCVYQNVFSIKNESIVSR
jgi:hypothetical protein